MFRELTQDNTQEYSTLVHLAGGGDVGLERANTESGTRRSNVQGVLDIDLQNGTMCSVFNFEEI